MLEPPLGDHQGILPCPARPLIRFHELDHRPRNPKPAVPSAIEADPVEEPPVNFLCRGFADRALSHSARPPAGPPPTIAPDVAPSWPSCRACVGWKRTLAPCVWR